MVAESSLTANSSEVYHTTKDQFKKNGWYLSDSGANVGVQNVRDNFITYNTLKTPVLVHDATGKASKAVGIGDVVINVHDINGSIVSITVKDQLYIPTFACNIFSEEQMRSQGYSFISGRTDKKDTPKTCKAPDGVTEIKLIKSNNLHYFGTTSLVSNSQRVHNVCNNVLKEDNVFEKWMLDPLTPTEYLISVLIRNVKRNNRRRVQKLRLQLATLGTYISLRPENDEFLKFHHLLGHVNVRETIRLAKLYGMKFNQVTDTFCEHCAIHKGQHERKSKKSKEPKTKTYLWRKISCDIAGPIIASTIT